MLGICSICLHYYVHGSDATTLSRRVEQLTRLPNDTPNDDIVDDVAIASTHTVPFTGLLVRENDNPIGEVEMAIAQTALSNQL